MTRLLYNLIFPVVLLLLLPGYLLRMARRGNYRHKFSQRFGIYDSGVRTKLAGRRWTWIHAVSVGEVMIALKLVVALRKERPDINIVLSTTTSTGYALASKNDAPNFETIYFPLDFPPIVKRAFRAIRPERLIFVEAEVWPNVIARARKLGIPRILVNARLSQRSEKRYRFVRPFTAAIYNQLDILCIQDPSDAPRWRELGVREEKIHLTGSVKFDSEQTAASVPQRDFRPVLRALGVADAAPILLAASTFDGEEVLLAETQQALSKQHPALFLILVPRHAERGEEIARQLAARGFHAVLRCGNRSQESEVRSQNASSCLEDNSCATLHVASDESKDRTSSASSSILTPDSCLLPSPSIYIVNTTGELRDWYTYATVAFIGKTLSPAARGGQNPAEPLMAGCPIIFGPNMQNFQPLAAQLIANGGAIEVNDASQLSDAVTAQLSSPARRTEMVAAGRACLGTHRGATRRTVEVIMLLGSFGTHA